MNKNALRPYRDALEFAGLSLFALLLVLGVVMIRVGALIPWPIFGSTALALGGLIGLVAGLWVSSTDVHGADGGCRNLSDGRSFARARLISEVVDAGEGTSPDGSVRLLAFRDGTTWWAPAIDEPFELSVSADIMPRRLSLLPGAFDALWAAWSARHLQPEVAST